LQVSSAERFVVEPRIVIKPCKYPKVCFPKGRLGYDIIRYATTDTT